MRNSLVVSSLTAILSLFVASQAWAGCESVFLPDLSGPENVQTAGAIPITILVPPLEQTPAGEGLYPFTVVTAADGTVTVYQTVGTEAKHVRQWTGIARVSMVSWFHDMPYDFPKRTVQVIAYLTLPNTAPPGVEPTWAFRIPMQFDASVTANLALSTPINLGEVYNVGIINHSPWVIGINFQLVMQLCH